jgi:hypothetical protein
VLTEEYSVSADGVRQDFVVAERPAGTGELRVELALSGAHAETAAAGVKLTLDGSGRALVYGRLRAVDATGRELAATMDVLGTDRLALRVDDVGAAYPVRIDPTFSDEDWVSLNPGIPGANEFVFAAVVDGSGNLYIGGYFTFAGTVAANYVAKWDRSAWSALGSGTSDGVYAVAVDAANHLFVSGVFYFAGTTLSPFIAQGNLPPPPPTSTPTNTFPTNTPTVTNTPTQTATSTIPTDTPTNAPTVTPVSTPLGDCPSSP